MNEDQSIGRIKAHKMHIRTALGQLIFTLASNTLRPTSLAKPIEKRQPLPRLATPS